MSGAAAVYLLSLAVLSTAVGWKTRPRAALAVVGYGLALLSVAMAVVVPS